MDGFEAATAIKARKRTQHVPIIFLTAADRDAHLAFRGYAAGAVDYITKPFDPWVLRAKVSVFVELWSKNDQLREAAEASQRRDAEYATALAAAMAALDTLAAVADCDEVDKLRAAVADASDSLRRVAP
jgi:PleD family two-component response regulator